MNRAPDLATGWSWLNTRANPRRWAGGYSNGMTGWSLHAVPTADTKFLKTLGLRPAACGLRPRHGWSIDFHLTEYCKGCMRALKKGQITESAAKMAQN